VMAAVMNAVMNEVMNAVEIGSDRELSNERIHPPKDRRKRYTSKT
jgi:hypothetical protein